MRTFYASHIFSRVDVPFVFLLLGLISLRPRYIVSYLHLLFPHPSLFIGDPTTPTSTPTTTTTTDTDTTDTPDTTDTNGG
jgi:hypothetical protein